jgi:hypothetical protein
MQERSDSILQYLLLLVSGLALIFLAHTGVETASPTTARVLEVIGFALAGYAPIRLIMSLKALFSKGWQRRIVDRAFRSEVKIISHRENLPLLIVTGAHCVTPPFGGGIDLRKFQRLRAYCEFIQSEDGQKFPPLLVVTGRSQGYAHMLAQALGMVDGPLDLPFIIENGAALYFPVSKRTLPLVDDEQRKVIEKARRILVPELPNNEFEPKTHMITINPLPYQQTSEDLRQDVVRILTKARILKFLTIASFVSAIDITPKGINKLSGLKAAIQEYYNLRMERWESEEQGPDMNAIVEPALKKTVGIAVGSADLCVLREVGRAYCSAYHVDPEIISFVTQHCGDRENVIDLEHIDAVIAVIERECGLRII